MSFIFITKFFDGPLNFVPKASAWFTLPWSWSCQQIKEMEEEKTAGS